VPLKSGVTWGWFHRHDCRDTILSCHLDAHPGGSPNVKSLCGVVCAGLLSICLPLAAAEKPAADNPTAHLKVLPGFQVEQLYSVPRDTEGSWVSMCVDPRGRLIVCDQYGGLFRVTPPGINHAEELKLEKIDIPLGEAQGLLWANDSLYVVVNKVQKYQSGLYRVRDTNNDDQLDHVELLHSLADGSGTWPARDCPFAGWEVAVHCLR